MKAIVTWYRDLERWDVKRYLNRIRSSFPIARLGEYIYEHSEKVKLSDYPDRSFPILGVTNKTGVYLNTEERGSNINQPYKVVRGGEITYNPYRVNVGSIGIVPDGYDGFYISPAYVVFGVKESVLAEYVYLVLSSDWFNTFLRSATSGSVRQNLTYDLLASLQIPLPPLEIQRQIVEDYNDALDKAEVLRAKADEKEREIDEYLLKELGIEKKEEEKKKGAFVVRFKDLERWDVDYNSKKLLTNKKAKYNWRPLSDYCTLSQYGFTGSAIENDTGTRFLRITDINYSGKYSEKNLPYVDIKEKEKGKYLLGSGDFLIARTGATAGKCCIVQRHKDEVVFASYLIRFKFNKEINLDFLEQYLNQGPGKRIINDAVYSSAQPNINANQIQEIKIPLPPLDIQKKIVTEIEEMRSQITDLRSRADEIERQARDDLEKVIMGDDFHHPGLDPRSRE